MTNKLNKLQIRAKVFDIINSYQTEDDLSSKLHLENLKFFNSLDNKEFALEILLREILSTESLKLEAIKAILIDFATLEMVEETIWTILKDKNISDKKKEIYLQLLRGLGGKIDVALLMDCMQNFDNVIDEQTKTLLEVATVNPEAQVDFLDFLFSLKPIEQISLIKSLHDDFQGDELANILSPCLRIRLDEKVKEEVINILGQSNSFLAVKPLKTFATSNENDLLKRQSLKALNQLKTSGIDIDNIELINLRESEICKTSKFHKAFLSQVDGGGNQGLIFSRIDDSGKIIMFSTVININDGIIDCFGLFNITNTDFQKVITRFKNNDLVIPISPSIAINKLQSAEEKNKEKGLALPYEYLCWNIYTADIEEEKIDFDSILTEKIDNFDQNTYLCIYDSGTFDNWYFEYDDTIEVKNFIDYIVSLNNKELNQDEIENKANQTTLNVFNAQKTEEYSHMLKEAAFVFFQNKDFERANICMNLASEILNKEEKFLIDIVKRSVLQYLATIIAEDEPISKTPTIFGQKEEKNISQEEAFKLLQNLEKIWS